MVNKLVSTLNIGIVTRFPWLFFIFSAMTAAFFFQYIPDVKNVEDVDYFIISDDPDNLFYEEFKEVFGNDEFFIIAFRNDDFFTARNLTILKQITQDLETIEEVREVKSLANVDDTIGENDYFEVRKFLESIPQDHESLNNLKKQAVSNQLYLRNLISPDATTAAIVVSAYERPDDEHYRHRLMEKTYSILKKYDKDVGQFYLAGKTVTDTTMSDYMKRDVAILLPLSYLLISICIYLFYKNLILTILGIVNITVCLGCVIGFMGVTGITQNSITSIVLPLVMALALCDTVHIYSHMDSDVLLINRDRRSAMSSVLKKVVFPCLMTTLTTMIGFMSLAVSKLPPIKEFAYTASAGLVFEFVFSFALLPPMLLLFKPERLYQNYHKKSFVQTFLKFVSRSVYRYRIIILWSGVLMVFSLFFCAQIKIETNIIKFFKHGSTIRKSLEYVESSLGGVDSLDIALISKEADAFKEPSNLKVIEGIENFVRSLKGVDNTISFNDFIKDMNKSFHSEDAKFYKIPETRELVSQYLLLYDSDEIDDYINMSYDRARISIRVSEHNSTRQKEMIVLIQGFLNTLDHPNIDIRVTGRVVQDVNVIEDILWGQIKSLALAMIIIWGVMFLLIGSFKIGMISLIPNIVPIVFNFGIMGFWGIPLNTATALISAVAIGIAVDDTIHFLMEFKKARDISPELPEIIGQVIDRKGRAMLSSSVILSIGFAVLAFSNFVPTVYFGSLGALIMISALLADIFLLPAIILCLGNEQ